MARTDDPRHAQLMTQVSTFLLNRGFNVSEQTYHNGCMPHPVVQRLQTTFSPTALHIRANADRIAVNPIDGMALYFEVKAGLGQDILIEALPLSDHMYLAQRGILCLYCILDRAGVHRGFWAHNVPPMRTLFIPQQRTTDLEAWYGKVLLPCFSSVRDICYLPWRGAGSGDPFIAIDHSIVQIMPSWQQLIDQEHNRWISAWSSL